MCLKVRVGTGIIARVLSLCLRLFCRHCPLTCCVPAQLFFRSRRRRCRRRRSVCLVVPSRNLPEQPSTDDQALSTTLIFLYFLRTSVSRSLSVADTPPPAFCDFLSLNCFLLSQLCDFDLLCLATPPHSQLSLFFSLSLSHFLSALLTSLIHSLSSITADHQLPQF